MVVIGAQSLCLLLTLLAAPVAYSLFDDLAHVRLWNVFRLVNPRCAIALLFVLLLFVSQLSALQEDYSLKAVPRVGVGMVERKLTLRDAVEGVRFWDLGSFGNFCFGGGGLNRALREGSRHVAGERTQRHRPPSPSLAFGASRDEPAIA